MQHVPICQLVLTHGITSSVQHLSQRKQSGWKREPMAVTILPAIGFVHIAQRRAGDDFERTWTVLGQDLSGLSGRVGGEELLIDGALIEGTLTVGTEETLIEGLAIVGGVCLESLSDMALTGIRSSSRGSGLLLFPVVGAAGNGLTTPVVQKSFLFVGLILPS
jgi:hypothetical protein